MPRNNSTPNVIEIKSNEVIVIEDSNGSTIEVVSNAIVVPGLVTATGEGGAVVRDVVTHTQIDPIIDQIQNDIIIERNVRIETDDILASEIISLQVKDVDLQQEFENVRQTTTNAIVSLQVKDIDLQQQITDMNQANLDAVISLQLKDVDLQDQIDTHQASLNSISSAIDTIESELNDKIDQEIQDRIAGDTALADAITNIALTPGPQGPQGIQGPQGPQGIQGETGQPGPMGPAGPQGIPGPQGEQGPHGAPFRISMTYSSIAELESDISRNDGDFGLVVTNEMAPDNGKLFCFSSGSWTFIVDMAGQPGIQGPIGPAGPAGPQGDPGPQGIQGPAGPQGPQGIQGLQGLTGPQGEQGPTGPAGATGATGATGPAGPGVASGGTIGQVLTKNSNADFDTKWAAPSAGLLRMVEQSSTAAPNATIEVSGFKPVGTTTSVDLVLSPLGTGAIVAQIPDNTAANGNKRGLYAVDLQLERQSATQVAAGNYSVALGFRNRVAGTGSVGIGSSNTINSSQYGYVLGTTNTISGNNDVAIGTSNYSSGTGGTSNFLAGVSNTAAGTETYLIGKSNNFNTTGSYFVFGKNNTSTAGASNALVLGNSNSISQYGSVIVGNSNTSNGNNSRWVGISNTGSGNNSFILGDYNIANADKSILVGIAGKSNKKSAFVHGYMTTSIGNEGKFQRCIYPLGNNTTTSAERCLVYGESVSGNTEGLVIPLNYLFSFDMTLCAKSATNCIIWDVKSALMSTAANSASFVGTPSIIKRCTTNENLTWSFRFSIVNNILYVYVTGEASTSIQWVGNITTIETFLA